MQLLYFSSIFCICNGQHGNSTWSCQVQEEWMEWKHMRDLQSWARCGCLQDSQAFEEQIGEKEEPLLALPPLFTRNDEPNDYHFQSYYGNDPPTLRTTGALSIFEETF